MSTVKYVKEIIPRLGQSDSAYINNIWYSTLLVLHRNKLGPFVTLCQFTSADFLPSFFFFSSFFFLSIYWYTMRFPGIIFQEDDSVNIYQSVQRDL